MLFATWRTFHHLKSGHVQISDPHYIYFQHTSTSSPAKSAGKHSESSHHLLQDVVTALEKIDLVTDTISLGDNKFMGVCKLQETDEKHNLFRRLDIR